jgi:hypothetical protein
MKKYKTFSRIDMVSTFFHPANRPIDFVKSFSIFLLIRLGLGLELGLGGRVGVGT